MARKITKRELLEDIRETNKPVEGVITKAEYRESGEYSFGVVYRIFDSWPDARGEAGVEGKPESWNSIPNERLIQSLKDFAEYIEDTPTQKEMEMDGPHSISAYKRAFGSWNDALREAGLEVNHPWGKEKPEYLCDYCGNTFRKHESQMDEGDNKYCSEDCKNEWMSENRVGENHPQYNRVGFECDYCGGHNKRPPCFVNEDELNFCDYECMGKYRSENWTGENSVLWEGGGVTVNCSNCGGDKSVKPAVEKAYENHFCDDDCLGEYREDSMSGSGNPNWGGGKDVYYGPNWHKQRRAVLQRDNHRCQACGISQESHVKEHGIGLHAHHIKPLREFTDSDKPDYEAANKLDNLVTYCIKCHHEWEGVPVRPVAD